MEKNILIIERNTEAVFFYKQLLQVHGYAIDHVSSDSQLLKYDFSIPDLFIINSRFLTLNEWEICQHLKSSPLTKNIPVIIISGAPDIEDVARRCAAVFMEKPFISADLLATIKRCLDNVQ
jgi:DNA-binding response OmpR family regulator